MSLREKLDKIAEPASSNWVEEVGKELAEQGARKNARKLALRVLQALHEQGLSQTQLAEKMQVSRQQVTKIIKGQENFTFETVDKLEKALGITLMTIESPHHSEIAVGIPDGGIVHTRGKDKDKLGRIGKHKFGRSYSAASRRKRVNTGAIPSYFQRSKMRIAPQNRRAAF